RPCRNRTRSASILPFRFPRQTVTRQTVVVGLNFHAFSIFALGVLLITPLVLGNLLLLTQPVTVRRPIVPTYNIDRRVGANTPLLGVFKTRVKFLEFCHRD